MDHDAFGADRDLFDVPTGIAYFNTASLSPLLHTVREAGESALHRRSRPWTIDSSNWFGDVERLRDLFAGLIGATGDGVALVPATSYGFAVAAHTLRIGPGDRVLVLAQEYPSGIYTWRATGAELVTVARADGRSWTEAVLEALDERITVVSVPNVHWTDGSLIDLSAVAERAHAIGARLVIDGSQSIGAMPLDVGRLRPDFVVTVGYKWLLGPFGVGYLYVAEAHRDGRPIEQNWINRAGSADFARLVDYRDDYHPGARRFDVGQRSQFELLPMAIAALTQITEWGVDSIADTLARVNAAISARTTELGLDAPPPDQRGPHLLGLPVPERSRATILSALADTGCHAAIRGGSLRISPHRHITADDIDHLGTALRAAAQ